MHGRSLKVRALYYLGDVAQLGERTVRIRKVESSILFVSTNLIAGRTPEVTIVVLPYGFVLATQIKDRL